MRQFCYIVLVTIICLIINIAFSGCASKKFLLYSEIERRELIHSSPDWVITDRTSIEFWKQHGLQTLPDSDMIRFVQSELKGDSIQGLRLIYTWMNKNITFYPAGGKWIGILTAREIFHRKHASGCHDWALLFASLAREAGYAVRVVEAFDVDWIKNKGRIRLGHVFIEVYLENQGWKLIEPVSGTLFPNYPGEEEILIAGKKLYRVWKRGVDSWDMGITSKELLYSEMDKIAETNNSVSNSFQNWMLEYISLLITGETG